MTTNIKHKLRLQYNLLCFLQVSHSSRLSDPQRPLYHRPVPGPGSHNSLLGGECEILSSRKVLKKNLRLTVNHFCHWIYCQI